MIVVLDANVWLKERLLRSAAGVASLHAVRRMGAKLLLPSSTRNEVLVGVVRDGLGAVNKVDSGLGVIQSLIGQRPGINTPSEGDFRTAAGARFDELSALIDSVDVTSEHLTRALNRVTEHRPPARTTEQFRDCLLWECLLDSEDECLLVTNDGDFLDKTAKVSVLAPELAEESGGKVRLFTSLADLLDEIEPQLPPINVDRISDAIAAVIAPELENAAATQTWRPGHLTGSSIKLYATERPATTTVVFEMTFAAFDGVDVEDTPVDEGVAVVTGECLFSDESGITEMRLDRIDLFTLEGDRLKGGVAYLHAHSGTLGGPPPVPYTVKRAIPGGPA